MLSSVTSYTFSVYKLLILSGHMHKYQMHETIEGDTKTQDNKNDGSHEL